MTSTEDIMILVGVGFAGVIFGVLLAGPLVAKLGSRKNDG